jgi:hypothetical protein
MAFMMESESRSWHGVWAFGLSITSLEKGMRWEEGVWLVARRERTYGRAALYVVLAHRSAVVHGVEGGDLVDTHRRHLEQPGDFVHDADAGEAMLSLSQIEEGHHGRFLVLGRIPRQHLFDELFILRRELEWNGWIVIGGIAVLSNN